MDEWITKCGMYVITMKIIQLQKKLYSDSYYHVNEPQYNYAKWKKQDIKGHIIYDSIYMKYIE